ncbi:MAG TPA: polyphenol oxidase family protein [Acidimicrobiia bacterium]|nr:polyphenol oxidase family protein [Acidimicrobiia bacterium]
MGFIALEVDGARVAFTDRHGGVSIAPYDTANLGFATGDDPAAVTENRGRVAHELGEAPDARGWAWGRQVHGARVADVDSAGGGGDADALVTTGTDISLVVLAADCAPIALVAGSAVAAVHCGWRGLLAGVVDAAVRRVRKRGRGPVRAVVGPCISPEHYEFGADELEQVTRRLGPAVAGRTESGAPALDLRAGVGLALTSAGVDDRTDVDVCTYASADHFSHRRDGVTGRQALIVTRGA